MNQYAHIRGGKSETGISQMALINSYCIFHDRKARMAKVQLVASIPIMRKEG